MTATTRQFDRPARVFLPARLKDRLPGQLASFAAIGAASTTAYVLIYTVLRAVSPAAAANAFALVLTAVGNTAANRRLTFRVEGRDGLARHHAAGLIALAVALALTSASLGILHFVVPHSSRMVELAVLVAANAAATIARFLLLRGAIRRGGIVSRPIALAAVTLPESKRNRG
jgi:putative flippase GtrA